VSKRSHDEGPRGAAAHHLVLLSLVILHGMVLASTAAAQARLELRLSREPFYPGVPVELHVSTTELDAEPEPSCWAEEPEAGQLTFRGIIPNISSSVRIVNGRISRSESATFTCQYQFVAPEPGSYRVGPFRMTQAGQQLEIQSRIIEVRAIPLDPRLRVRVLVPEEPIYVGQHLPVRIEWWLEQELKDRIHRYSIRSRLFEATDAFRFIGDPVASRGDQILAIETAEGELSLRATVTERREGGRTYLVLGTERTLVPLRTGEFDLAAATVHVDEITRWQRDLFGRRTAAGTRKIFSRDVPRKLIVKAPPSRGQPDSFAGAVGRGFSLEVAADRSVVQLGDPITLTLTVRGDGNLASVGPPRLDAGGGLSAEQFRLPEGDVSGRTIDDAKVFQITLRVLDDSVREVPALAYSWFDPELDEYQTAKSRPIALSVRPAQVISADDVMAATPEPRIPTMDEPEASPTQPESPPTRRGSFSLTGADLSVVHDPEVLLRRDGRRSGFRVAAYGGSVALVLVALWARRRAEVDPELKRRRQVYRDQCKRIAAAGATPRRQALSEIAVALREITAAAPELRSRELDDFVRECDAATYAPGDDADANLDPEVIRRAEALLATMKEALQ
jgi:hypothetical protein